MYYVMPRSPKEKKKNLIQKSFPEGQDTLTELHACLQTSHDEACSHPHPLLPQQGNEQIGSHSTKFNVWQTQEVRTQLKALVYSKGRNQFKLFCALGVLVNSYCLLTFLQLKQIALWIYVWSNLFMFW